MPQQQQQQQQSSTSVDRSLYASIKAPSSGQNDDERVETADCQLHASPASDALVYSELVQPTTTDIRPTTGTDTQPDHFYVNA